MLTVGSFVDVVERRTAVEKIGADGACVKSGARHSVEDLEDRHHAVDHCGIDDLTFARALSFKERADHTKREMQTAAGEVTKDLQHWYGWHAFRPDRTDSSSHRLVIQ